jgi:Asp/Glu/hydantoin racemase
MLREVLDDALSRGERLKHDIITEIVSSATLRDLINNKSFIDTITKIIRTKHEVSTLIRDNVQEALKAMHIPSRSQLNAFERKVLQLERQLDQVSRKLVLKAKKKTTKKKAKKTAKKTAKKKVTKKKK